MAEQIRATQTAWFTSPNKYSDALRVLPDLIINSERAVHESGRSVEACRQASEVYMVTRAVLKYLGRTDLCGLVSDRAMSYAEEADDPLVIAAATWNLGHAMLTDDMPAGALDLAMMGAEKLAPLLPDGSPEHFALYGGLQLVATLGALRTGDPWRARELLRGPAHQAALRVDEMHNYHNTLFFGSTNVGIHMVRVEYECGEIAEALRLADNRQGPCGVYRFALSFTRGRSGTVCPEARWSPHAAVSSSSLGFGRFDLRGQLHRLASGEGEGGSRSGGHHRPGATDLERSGSWRGGGQDQAGLGDEGAHPPCTGFSSGA